MNFRTNDGEQDSDLAISWLHESASKEKSISS
jgi:hypothetical protein